MNNHMKPTQQVNFRVTPDEYTLIKANAESLKRTLTAYLREVAINKMVIDYNYRALLKHAETINRIRSDLNYLIHMLNRTGKIYPADINRLIDLLEELTDTERKLLQDTQKERAALRKYVKKVLSANINHEPDTLSTSHKQGGTDDDMQNLGDKSQ